MLHLRASRAAFARVRVAMSAILCACALVACSGGGGGGSAPSLALTPASTSTTPGGAAVALHAAVTGSGATPSWTLSGPGTLSAASGTDVTYTPPAATPGNEAATATITASVAGQSKQAQVALAEVDGPGHHWSLALAPGTYWTDVAFGGGRFVAVGWRGTVVTSTDGQHWTHADSPDRTSWRSVAYGAGVGWVVVGGDNQELTSPDGVTWTAQSGLQNSGAFEPARVVFGNGVFVAAGPGGSSVSTDGKTWTDLGVLLYDVAFGNGVFVGSAQGGPVASTDGRTWPATTGSGLLPQANDGVAFGNGVFVANTGGTVSTSPDAIHWTAVPIAPASGGQPSFAIDRFYLQYAGGSSVDGRTWVNDTAPNGRRGAANGDGTVVVVTVTDLGTTPTNVALGSGASVASATPVLRGTFGTFNAIDCGGAGCLALMPYYAFRSSDRTTWTGRPLQASADGLLPSALTHVGPAGTFVAAGSHGNYIAAMTSLDGLDWVESTVPTQWVNGGYGVTLASTPQGLLALTALGTVMTSADGGTWADSGRIDLGAAAVVYGGGRYVAVGANTATSSDGLTWTNGTPLSNADGGVNLTGVVYDGQQYVAVGARGLVATSPDGATWTLHASASTAPLYAIARDFNGELVAVGDLGVVQTSVDGVHWTLRNSGTHRLLKAVTATPAGFYAAGEDNVILFSSN